MPQPNNNGPRLVKPRRAGGVDLTRLILRMRSQGKTEAQIDDEIAWLEWSSGFGRMWRYIGLQMGGKR